jgi:hypothetical protein
MRNFRGKSEHVAKKAMRRGAVIFGAEARRQNRARERFDLRA